MATPKKYNVTIKKPVKYDITLNKPITPHRAPLNTIASAKQKYIASKSYGKSGTRYI